MNFLRANTLQQVSESRSVSRQSGSSWKYSLSMSATSYTGILSSFSLLYSKHHHYCQLINQAEELVSRKSFLIYSNQSETIYWNQSVDNKSYKKSGQLTIADRCALIFMVTQGHWLIQSKTYIHDFLLVINQDLSSISHRLQDMVPRSWKPLHPILRPPDQGTPLNIIIKLNMQIDVVKCYFIVKTAWF